MAKSDKQILIEAKALIADPEHWCQGDYARDQDGMVISTLDAEAYCRCSYGAVGCASGVDPRGTPMTLAPKAFSLLDAAAYELVLRVRPKAEPISVVDLNDGEAELPGMTEHEAVMAAFDLAIEQAPA